MQTYSFEKLKVWQEARQYVVIIYQITSSFPKDEVFGLRSQIRRAAVSVTSNIAKGTGKLSGMEKARFTKMAYSSLMETLSQLMNAKDLGYINKDQVRSLRPKIDYIANMLSALHRNQLNNNPAHPTNKQINK